MKKTVLIIDDDKGFIKVVNAWLREEFYIISAETGKEGIEKAVKVKPDVIILDVYLPNVNGFAICETLKTLDEFKEIKIIIVSAYTGHKGYSLSRITQAQAFLTKPLKKDELKSTIYSLIK